ncbi:MAG: DNA/RNA helicase domain-containing protein, partial [Chthoniobacterales bacterium]
TEYCRRFHSAVDENARVHGCVLFTHQVYTNAYVANPNQKLTRDYPIFTTASQDVENRFPEFFRTKLTEPDEEFALKFATGRYRQQRGFVAQIGAQILNPESSPFELLDNQRRAFALCKAVVDECFLSSSHKTPSRRVVIVKGPPGSGKSAIAARLWASLVTDDRLPEGDVVFATTSMSQNSNWSYIFDQLATEGGQALVRKASIFTPLSTHALGTLRRNHGATLMSDAVQWRENLKLLRNLGTGFHDGSRDQQNLITVVDEAHSLINPEHTAGRGQFGFTTTLGPQAYHIIRASQLTIFLLDPEQGFRERENTTLEDVIKWSRELDAGEPEMISLEGAQFRCAGSAEYVAWLESLLQGSPVSQNKVPATGWQEPSVGEEEQELLRTAEQSPPFRLIRRPYISGFEFKLVDNPVQLEEELRNRAGEGNSVRILSS